MKEEQAVLDFFSQPENLPLGLSVAEQLDQIREQLNSRFWRELLARIDTLIAEQNLAWRSVATEDKNLQDSLVGLHLIPHKEQTLYLRPMMEQQYLGGTWRIYFGLMWSDPPTSAQSGLPAVLKLKTTLKNVGLNSNENFLAWQWTMLYPRRKDFLLRYSQKPAELLDEAEAILKNLLTVHRDALDLANAALSTSPQKLAAALNQVRDELIG